MKRSILVFFLIIALLVGGIPVDAASDYTDVSKKHWAYVDIQWATDAGLMNGTGKGKFSPEGAAERAMLVTILYRSAGSPPVSGTTPFTDLKQKWYQDAVLWAYQNEIVNGLTSNTFGPSVKITREQVATILYRYAKNYLNHNILLSGELVGYPDVGKVQAYAKDALLWATNEGVINGILKKHISYIEPQGKAVRSQLAAIFHRFEDYRKKANQYTSSSLVPDFYRMTKEEATCTAEQLKFRVVFQEVYDAYYEIGTVIKQSFTPGTNLAHGATITLTVAGPKPEPVDYSNYLTVATYMINNNARNNWSSIVANLRSTDADIVFLQKCGDGAKYEEVTPGTYSNQVEQLAHDLGYSYWNYARSNEVQEGHYGNGILSRYPIKESSVHVFQEKTTDHKILQRCILNVDGKDLVVYNTHLFGEGQFKDFVEKIEADYAADKFIIAAGYFGWTYVEMKPYVNGEKFMPLNGTETFGNGILSAGGANILVSTNIKDHYKDPDKKCYILQKDAEGAATNFPLLYSHIKLP